MSGWESERECLPEQSGTSSFLAITVGSDFLPLRCTFCMVEVFSTTHRRGRPFTSHRPWTFFPSAHHLCPAWPDPVLATKGRRSLFGLGGGEGQIGSHQLTKPREIMAGSWISMTLENITWSSTFGSRKIPQLEMEPLLTGATVVSISWNPLCLRTSV